LFLSVGSLNQQEANFDEIRCERREAASNSATGSLFKGERNRDFRGKLEFAGKTLAEISKSAPISSKGGSGGSVIKAMTRPPSGCVKWGVVTTIFEPTDAVRAVASLDGWCLVVVADNKTPADYMSDDGLKGRDNVIFLSASTQRDIIEIASAGGAGGHDFSMFAGAVPWNHFARKNIGYLYAIYNEAEVIFDFDDDNVLLAGSGGTKYLSPLPEEIESYFDLQSPPLAFNPYPLMQPSEDGTWPRGFPLEKLKEETPQLKEVTSQLKAEQVAVIQSLANNDPDVDAIYRLTRSIPFSFKRSDEGGNTFLVPPGTYTPYNAQATVHHAKSLFATLLPASVLGRVSDIWRGYFAERLFQDAGLSVAFVPTRVVQFRNAHNYLGDMDAESDLYFKTGKVLEFLDAWRDKRDSPTLAGRMEMLWVELYERDYIEIEDVVVLQLWLRALIACGYEFPGVQDNSALQPPTTSPVLPPAESVASPASMASAESADTPVTSSTAPPSSRKLKDNELFPEWQPPEEGYCYRQGNDWSACAGDHMLYPPTSATVLLKRADERKMCLHEALCWKQLPDWRTVDPPAWTCPHARSRRIYDMSFHNVVMADQSTFVEKSLNKFSGTDHKVFLCNCKNGKSAISNYHYPFNICPGVQGTECTKTKPR